MPIRFIRKDCLGGNTIALVIYITAYGITADRLRRIYSRKITIIISHLFSSAATDASKSRRKMRYSSYFA